MKTLPKRPDQALLLASITEATHALKTWVLAAAAVFVGLFETYLPRGMRIEMRGFVRDAAHDIRVLVVMCAAARWYGRAIRPGQTMRPASTPPGFRRQRARGSAMRRLRRGVRLRGRSIAARIAWLRGILSHLKTWAGRMLARLNALTSRPRLAAVRPPARVLRALFSPTCINTDTS